MICCFAYILTKDMIRSVTLKNPGIIYVTERLYNIHIKHILREDLSRDLNAMCENIISENKHHNAKNNFVTQSTLFIYIYINSCPLTKHNSRRTCSYTFYFNPTSQVYILCFSFIGRQLIKLSLKSKQKYIL